MNWNLYSWQNFENTQEITYLDKKALNLSLEALRSKKNIVKVSEIKQLQSLLKKAALGKVFIIQGGDCAESFNETSKNFITAKLNCHIFLNKYLAENLKVPIINIARMAGQYAKPRSLASEVINNKTYLSYRGDLINQKGLEARTPNPKFLLQAYKNSAEIYKLAKNLTSSIAPFFISHEALHLPYESSLTRQYSGKYYNLSAHLLWAGYRTTNFTSAHIEYLSGIANPVAIKVSPGLSAYEFRQIINKLNPDNIAGRVVAITRLGQENVTNFLPQLLDSCGDLEILWMCDPMHGNTKILANGLKTRFIADILQELATTCEILKSHKLFLSGIHLEMTGEAVTECVGANVTQQELAANYLSLVDPRLNLQQIKYLAQNFLTY